MEYKVPMWASWAVLGGYVVAVVLVTWIGVRWGLVAAICAVGALVAVRMAGVVADRFYRGREGRR